MVAGLWKAAPLSTFYNAKIITVEPILFLFALGKLFYVPIIEQYYYQYYGAKILSNTSFDPPKGLYCINSSLIDDYTGSKNSYKQDESQSNHLVIYTNLAATLPGVLVALIMGPVTDRYGRKLGILLPAIGSFLLGIGSIMIINFNVDPIYLVPVNLILGLTGDITTLIAACFAYTADVSSMRWRSFRIAVLEGFLAFGKLSGQLGGGYWLRRVNCNFLPLMIFYTASTAVMILYTVFIPESHTSVERKKLLNKDGRRFFDKYVKGVKLYCSGLSFSTYVLYVSTVALFIAVLSVQGSFAISVYFLKAVPFEFNPLQIGYYQALKSATQGIFCILFFLFVLCDVRDSALLLGGFVVSGICNVVTGFAKTTWELYTIASIQGFGSTVFASGRGLVSKLVKPDEQGALFSILASTESLSYLLAFTVWPFIFPVTLRHNMQPGSTYIFMGVLEFMIVPFIISIMLMNWKPTVMKDTIETRRNGHTNSSISSSTTSSNNSDDDQEYQPLMDSASHGHNYLINR